jgi:predicted Zn-ribbon and HTH transcriptional regulator
VENLKCTACGNDLHIDQAVYDEDEKAFHWVCLEESGYERHRIRFKPRSKCNDCGVIFNKAMIIEIVGEGKHFHCPECKGEKVRFILPDHPGMRTDFEVNISFDAKVCNLFSNRLVYSQPNPKVVEKLRQLEEQSQQNPKEPKLQHQKPLEKK